MLNLKLAYDYALALCHGIPYKWGGSNSLTGFDCSGLVQEILSSIGQDPPGDQTAQGLYDYFFKNGFVNVLGLGALAFYGKDIKSITHVVFMLDDFSAIGANGGGSQIKTFEDAEKMNAFIKIRPINYRKDLVAVVMPNYNQ